MLEKVVLSMLLDLAEGEDAEQNHVKADGLISSFLKELGYTEIADAYNAVPKWYS